MTMTRRSLSKHVCQRQRILRVTSKRWEFRCLHSLVSAPFPTPSAGSVRAVMGVN
uniref:Uncharacterized protein n=1 Tax=Anguilla anguilla TaxID=7936 RepID=A0A0E9UVE9_ANGAN